jgi:hypothetical protein
VSGLSKACQPEPVAFLEYYPVQHGGSESGQEPATNECIRKRVVVVPHFDIMLDSDTDKAASLLSPSQEGWIGSTIVWEYMVVK